MGCSQSKIDEEEAVMRCKDRKTHMRLAVSARNAFSSRHSAYTVSLKYTGSALSEYGQGEVLLDPAYHPPSITVSSSFSSSSSSAAAAAVIKPPLENLRPPPPLPNFSPLQRSVSMPDLPVPKPAPRSDPAETIQEEEDEEEEASPAATATELSPRTPPPLEPLPQQTSSPLPPPSPPTPPQEQSRWDYFFENIPGPTLAEPETPIPPPVTPEKVMVEPPPPPPEKVVVKPLKKKKQSNSNTVHHQHAASTSAVVASVEGGKRGKAMVMSSVSLTQIMKDLDEHFLKAYESAHEVSNMLEANRFHYHSNFADNRGHIDHSAKVMRVITWNRSFRGIPNTDEGKDDFDSDESETHATVLDKLLAWEKKLYDEVKAGELMKIEYQKKVALLNKQKKRNTNPEALEKTKAAVSHLHTRYIVDMQSMDSTVSEIQRLRDAQLYPKLVKLVDGMAKMWETMCDHHEKQLNIAMSNLKHVKPINAPKETSKQHQETTTELHKILNQWHDSFEMLFTHQKEYIQALNNWLKLNLIPIESSIREKVSSPPRVQRPPILSLIHAWHEHLDKIPFELAKSAIQRFTAIMNTIMVHQQEEMKQKEKCEEAKREYVKKSRVFEDWNMKYQQKKIPAASEEAESGEDTMTTTTTQNDPLKERLYQVELSKKKWEEEVEAHQKLCRQVREKSLVSLKNHLPELFRALWDFAGACSEMYKNLSSIAQNQNQEDHSPN